MGTARSPNPEGKVTVKLSIDPKDGTLRSISYDVDAHIVDLCGRFDSGHLQSSS